MPGSASRFPDVIFLRRTNNSGYGFLYANQADFEHAADSFVKPILRSFSGKPIPNQPNPQDHLKTAIATFLGQAFDGSVVNEVGAEGVSRAAAACIRHSFKDAVPAVIVIEQRNNRLNVRPGIEFMRHPGYPTAVIVDGDAHGGDAHFFPSAEAYRKSGESRPTAKCWLPQIVYRLYARTPSVMIGRPIPDKETGKTSIACRGLNFGLAATLEERIQA